MLSHSFYLIQGQHVGCSHNAQSIWQGAPSEMRIPESFAHAEVVAVSVFLGTSCIGVQKNVMLRVLVFRTLAHRALVFRGL
jgi:hypothetical protein